MLEAVITLLIYVCIIALVIYVVFYVIEALGIPLPPMVKKIVFLIFALIVLLYILRLIVAGGGIALPVITWLTG